MLKVLLVDDHPVMRLGARQLIEDAWPDAEVDDAESIADAAARFRARPADLVVLDLGLPDASGVEGAALMLRLVGPVPILVMSQHAESAFAAPLLQMGVRGYLPKNQAGAELVRAMQRLLDGGRYVTAATAERLLGLADGSAAGVLPHALLSAQEFRVMQLIAAGRSASQIAQAMQLSVKTVGSYRARVMAKAGWGSNAEIAKYCLQHGLAEPG